jgi:hypothetical protein
MAPNPWIPKIKVVGMKRQTSTQIISLVTSLALKLKQVQTFAKPLDEA